MKSIYDSIETFIYNHKIKLIAVSFILGILLNEYTRSLDIYCAMGLVAAALSLLKRNLSFLLFIPLGSAFSANSQLIPENNVLNFTGGKLILKECYINHPNAGSRA